MGSQLFSNLARGLLRVLFGSEFGVSAIWSGLAARTTLGVRSLPPTRTSVSRLKPRTGDLSAQATSYAELGLGMALGATGPTILRSASSTGVLFAGWRLILGFVAYAAVMRITGRTITLRLLKDSFPAGVCFGLSIGSFYAAIEYTSVTNALVIGALRPAIMIAVVGPFMNEKVTKQTIFWTAVAIGGAAYGVIAAQGGDSGASFFGDLIALGGVFSGVGYMLFTKRAREHHESFGFTTSMMLAGALVMFPLAPLTGDGLGLPPSEDWTFIALMVAIPGVGHVFNNRAMADLPLVVVSNAFLLLPGVAAAIAWLIVDEPILLSDVIGMAVTIGGLAMVIWTTPQSERDEGDEVRS